jgi:hypothetical protein
MSTKAQAIWVNALLVAIAAFALFPLAWMASVSLMAPGEASTYPPPILPAHATLANYRELFERAGMGRHLANSAGVATAITLLSLCFNLSAGYAFAKLHFPGRERVFRFMLAALLIPAQVAMIPLFLMMKWLHLVNSYGGVVVPALATVFGIFLVRQYARSIPTSCSRPRASTAPGVAHLHPHRAAAVEARRRDARDLHLPRELERFHVALDRAERPGLADGAGRARRALARARPGQRADDGGLGGHGAAGAGAVPGAAALLHPGPACSGA